MRCMRQLRFAVAGVRCCGSQGSDSLRNSGASYSIMNVDRVFMSRIYQKSASGNLVLRREAKMKKHFAMFVLLFLILGISAPQVFAQASGTVKGVCKDTDGKPIPDAVVVYANQDNGQKYTLKTNKKGEYFSLGVASGKYIVTLYKTADDAKANKEMFHQNGFQVQLDENTLDFDLQKEQQKAAQGQGLTPNSSSKGRKPSRNRKRKSTRSRL